MKMRLKLALLMEVKEKTGDGIMLGYLMKKIEYNYLYLL